MMPEIRLAVIHCTVCRENKEPSEFFPSGRGSKTGQCKSCVKKRTRDRKEERAKAGLPRRNSKKTKAPRPSSPPSVSAESLMKALAGGAADPRLEAALQIVAMQQRTVELLLERRRK